MPTLHYPARIKAAWFTYSRRCCQAGLPALLQEDRAQCVDVMSAAVSPAFASHNTLASQECMLV